MSADQWWATIAAVVTTALLLAWLRVAWEDHQKAKQRRDRRAEVQRYHAQRLAVLPHQPAAVFLTRGHSQMGWAAACSYDSCIDRDSWLVHDDPWDALQDACLLLREQVHGPSDPPRRTR